METQAGSHQIPQRWYQNPQEKQDCPRPHWVRAEASSHPSDLDKLLGSCLHYTGCFPFDTLI